MTHDAEKNMVDPRDALAAGGAGSAAYLNPEGTDFESLADYLARQWPYEPVPVTCMRCGWEGRRTEDHTCPSRAGQTVDPSA